MNLLPYIACAIHSIPIISRTITTMKFNKAMPSNGDTKTIVDIATANMPIPIDNDLELFDTCLDFPIIRTYTNKSLFLLYVFYGSLVDAQNWILEIRRPCQGSD
jgi:hypothetical protein